MFLQVEKRNIPGVEAGSNIPPSETEARLESPDLQREAGLDSRPISTEVQSPESSQPVVPAETVNPQAILEQSGKEEARAANQTHAELVRNLLTKGLTPKT